MKYLEFFPLEFMSQRPKKSLQNTQFSGEWRHHTHLTFKDRKWLGHISYKTGQFVNRSAPSSKVEEGESSTYYQSVMSQAHELIRESKAAAIKAKVPDQTLLFQGSKAEGLRWMVLPSEAQNLLLNPEGRKGSCRAPFSPKKKQSVKKEEKPRFGSLHSKSDLRVHPDLLSVRVTATPRTTADNAGKDLKVKEVKRSEKTTDQEAPTVSCTDGSCALEENSR